jgi:hypothetical protein
MPWRCNAAMLCIIVYDSRRFFCYSCCNEWFSYFYLEFILEFSPRLCVTILLYKYNKVRKLANLLYDRFYYIIH